MFMHLYELFIFLHDKASSNRSVAWGSLKNDQGHILLFMKAPKDGWMSEKCSVVTFQ
jgi:hypothetical protein